jgi:sugar lactone lactonase YvrE
MTDPRVAVAAKDRLGECPRWHAPSQSLVWLDIPAQALHRFDPATGAHAQTALTVRVSAFGFRSGGGLVLAAGSQLLQADDTGQIQSVLAAAELASDARFNDGAADAAGRFWVGALNAEKRPDNSLYCFAAGALRAVDGGIGASNGIAWSPDGRTMYFADSPRKTIYAYAFDAAAGTARNRRVFVHTPDEPGVPDGIAVDRDGGVWCAYWDGWRVVRYDSVGQETARIDVPTPRPTACAFGGKGLDVLYVTSASHGATPGDAAFAGDVFAIRTGAQGILPFEAYA